MSEKRKALPSYCCRLRFRRTSSPVIRELSPTIFRVCPPPPIPGYFHDAFRLPPPSEAADDGIFAPIYSLVSSSFADAAEFSPSFSSAAFITLSFFEYAIFSSSDTSFHFLLTFILSFASLMSPRAGYRAVHNDAGRREIEVM